MLQTEGETFLDEQKLKEFVVSSPCVTRNTKVIQAEINTPQNNINTQHTHTHRTPSNYVDTYKRQ